MAIAGRWVWSIRVALSLALAAAATTPAAAQPTSTTEASTSTSEPPSSTTVATSSSTSLPSGTSTTSSTTTPHSTTTSTLPSGGCDDVTPGSLDAVRCRLDILKTRIDGEAGLGKLRAKLASTLDRAVALGGEADTACTGGDTKTASRRMKQIQKLLLNMAHRLRGLAARKQVDATLRADLLATIDSIRADVGGLRKSPCD